MSNGQAIWRRHWRMRFAYRFVQMQLITNSRWTRCNEFWHSNILKKRMVFVIIFYYDSTALCLAFVAFSVSSSYSQLVWLLGRGIRPSQGRYLHTGQHKRRINAHTDIHTLSGNWTHDPSVRVSEDNSCLSPRGHCDRLFVTMLSINY
jgi:hypothetical protein